MFRNYLKMFTFLLQNIHSVKSFHHPHFASFENRFTFDFEQFLQAANKTNSTIEGLVVHSLRSW